VGFIRKAISSTVFLGTGVPVVQFRSDTERGTRQTKLLRREIERQGRAATAQSREFASTQQLPVEKVEPRVPREAKAPTPKKSESKIEQDMRRYELLSKLGELRDKGVLSEAEFQAEKGSLLGDTGGG